MTICDFFGRRKKKPKPKPPPVPVPKPPVPPTPGPPIPVPPKPPAGILIQVVNRSTVISDNLVRTYVPAQQIQVNRDYFGKDSDWTGGPVTFQAVGLHETTDPKAWQLLILDDSDQAGALGYHDVTPAGLPLGKVFAKTDLRYNASWTVTGSHEALEMLGDPNIDKTKDAPNGWTYIYENCDAVENNTYVVNGVELSDFVYQRWFGKGAGPYDFLSVLTKPFSLAPGGYISIDKHDGQGWTQEYGRAGARAHGYESRPKVGSRRERRGIPRRYWLRSAS